MIYLRSRRPATGRGAACRKGRARRACRTGRECLGDSKDRPFVERAARLRGAICTERDSEYCIAFVVSLAGESTMHVSSGLRRLWSLLAVVAGATACGSDDGSSGASAGAAAYQGQAGRASGGCSDGAECACANGGEGKLQCRESGGSVCICPECPGVRAPPKAPVDGCGGDPFGPWTATTVDFPWLMFSIAVKSNYETSVRSCASEITRQPVAPRVVLDLREGGSGSLSHSGVEVSLAFDTGCSGYCDTLELAGKCHSKDCNVCACDVRPQLPGGDIDWSREGDTLTLENAGGVPWKLKFCASDDKLTLHDPDSGLHLELARASFWGRPALCVDRTKDECAKGKGCVVGECTGPTKCAAASSEKACGTLQGCEWWADGCSGTVPSSCTFADYGVVPGCEASTKSPVCVGTAKACEKAGSAGACVGNTGCKYAEACIGPSQDCSVFEDDLFLCGGDCELKGDKCLGTRKCGSSGSQYQCGQVPGCSWVKCSGKPVACGNLPQAKCDYAPGCHLELP